MTTKVVTISTMLPMNGNSNLTSADLQAFARLGISAELVTQAGIERVTDEQARDKYGIRFSGDLRGIVFPYLPPVNGNGHRWTARLRRDNPEVNEDGKAKNKYISAYGDRRHLYFPPGGAELLTDVSVPVCLVEAEKSALALLAWSERIGKRLLPVAMGGCYGWHGKIGIKEAASGERVPQKGAIADLGYCNGREVIILLDSNASNNRQVRKARMQLAQELVNRECAVRIAELPESPSLNGPDDFIGSCGDRAMAEVIANARPFSELAKKQIESEISRLIAREGRVDAEDLDHYFELLAAIPDDEDRELLTTRLHKAMKGALTKATIKDNVNRLRLVYGSAQANLKEQARQANLKSMAINVADLVTELEHYFSQRAYLPEGAALTLSYWSMNTWTFDLFDTVPYLDIESAIPGCGKTTVISLLRVCRRAIATTALTEATTFRIANTRPTFLIDEAEFLEGKSDRAQLIRAVAHEGYKVGARVPRCNGMDNSQEVEWFDVYCPKLFAVIGGITGPLLERSIVIHMEKKPREMQLRRCREHLLRRDAEPLRQQLEAYALQAQAPLTSLYEKEPDEGYWPHISDREAEIWGPLLIHARLIGPAAEARLLVAYDLLSRQKTDIQEQEYDRALALEVREALLQHQGERFTPSDLVEYLDSAENWGAKLSKYKEGDAKSKSSTVGRFLQKFRLKSKDRGRIGATSKATSYLKREALDVLSAHTAQMSAASAALPQAFSTATTSHREANYLDSNRDEANFAADVAADAENSEVHLPQRSDDSMLRQMENWGKRSAALSAANSNSGKENHLDGTCGSAADAADISGVSKTHTPEKTDPAVHIRDFDNGELELPCVIHGRHTQWWIEIFPNGGEIVCAQCRPEPDAERQRQ